MSFRIISGQNPHTRTPWARKKKVDLSRALKQWHRLAQTLKELGHDVFIMPEEEEHPGLLFPANAGFLLPLDEPIPLSQKRFFLSNPIDGRKGEKEHIQTFLEGLGLPCTSIGARFEGEADFFPVQRGFIFTYGHLREDHWLKFSFSWPPVKMRFGFRSQYEALKELQQIVGPETEVLSLRLVNEAYYHGDMLLCPFGRGKQYIMAYTRALDEASQGLLREYYGESLLEVSDEDAQAFACNSFQVEGKGDNLCLLMPKGVSPDLQQKVREREVEPLLLDTSEFQHKAGASIKCMVADLGPAVDEENPQVMAFRQEHLYPNPFGFFDLVPKDLLF